MTCNPKSVKADQCTMHNLCIVTKTSVEMQSSFKFNQSKICTIVLFITAENQPTMVKECINNFITR